MENTLEKAFTGASLADSMRAGLRPFGFLFLIAGALASLGRMGLRIMTFSGAMAFDYISASNVPLLDVVCSILTGSAFVAFLFAASLVLGLSFGGSILYAIVYGCSEERAPRPLTAFFWGWATALVALLLLIYLAHGILSDVQIHSMSSKLPEVPILIAAVIGFTAFLGTLLGAASMAICACLIAKPASRPLGWDALLKLIGCGLPVMLATVGTFTAINQASPNGLVILAWLGLDLALNLFLLFVNAWFIKTTKNSPHARQS